MSTAIGQSKDSLADPFWETDLAEVERQMIGDDRSLTTFPVHLDNLVPHQGSVLLHRATWINVPKDPWHRRVAAWMRSLR